MSKKEDWSSLTSPGLEEAIVAADDDQRMTSQPKQSPSRLSSASDKQEQPAKKAGHHKSKGKLKSGGKPHRPLSAYNYFIKEERARIKAGTASGGSGSQADSEAARDDPRGEFISVGKVLAERWKALPEEKREKYKRMADDDMKRYQKAMHLFQLQNAQSRQSSSLSDSTTTSASAMQYDRFGNTDAIGSIQPLSVRQAGASLASAIPYDQQRVMAGLGLGRPVDAHLTLSSLLSPDSMPPLLANSSRQLTLSELLTLNQLEQQQQLLSLQQQFSLQQHMQQSLGRESVLRQTLQLEERIQLERQLQELAQQERQRQLLQAVGQPQLSAGLSNFPTGLALGSLQNFGMQRQLDINWTDSTWNGSGLHASAIGAMTFPTVQHSGPTPNTGDDDYSDTSSVSESEST